METFIITCAISLSHSSAGTHSRLFIHAGLLLTPRRLTCSGSCKPGPEGLLGERHLGITPPKKRKKKVSFSSHSNISGIHEPLLSLNEPAGFIKPFRGFFQAISPTDLKGRRKPKGLIKPRPGQPKQPFRPSASCSGRGLTVPPGLGLIKPNV